MFGLEQIFLQQVEIRKSSNLNTTLGLMQDSSSIEVVPITASECRVGHFWVNSLYYVIFVAREISGILRALEGCRSEKLIILDEISAREF